MIRLPHVLKHLQGAFSPVVLVSQSHRSGARSMGHSPAGSGQDSARPLLRGERDVRVSTRSTPNTFVRSSRAKSFGLTSTGLPAARLIFAATEPAHCVFEHVYFANPASRIFGQNVHMVREAMGRQLAREAPVAGRLCDADAGLRPQRGVGLCQGIRDAIGRGDRS